MVLSKAEHKRLTQILTTAYQRFGRPDFAEGDPIQVPKRFKRKEDIEISSFLTATIAWGQRSTIIRNANLLMERMDMAPADFIRNHSPEDRQRMIGFVHRTFLPADAMFFVERLQVIYREYESLECAFGLQKQSVYHRINAFRQVFLPKYNTRSEKHIAFPASGSAAKRINMFLRWMIRPDKEGVDFGLWTTVSAAELMLPLDVHTSTVARKLGLLRRRQNDWKAVEELTANLRLFDPADPVRFDYALFGLGVNKMKV